MIKVNLIMVEPRALMFLSSICGHNAEHLLLFFCFYLRFSICVRLHFKVNDYEINFIYAPLNLIRLQE